MAYSEDLAERVREELAAAGIADIDEIKMYGGLAFMVRDKMCACIGGDDGEIVMMRVGKERYDELLQKSGALPSIMKDKPIKGYIDLGVEGQKDLSFWVETALKFNEELVNSN
ncbi:TfoX/Sxy family protein [Patescibacteria group bacterium]|jgi:hypothetical protein|nr:TfoX/Sxy family protein [Patescibacteria group bacterium]HPG37372.1 TfoX/Sxy family protein [Candidatus Saccharibacteria bacterium]